MSISNRNSYEIVQRDVYFPHNVTKVIANKQRKWNIFEVIINVTWISCTCFLRNESIWIAPSPEAISYKMHKQQTVYTITPCILHFINWSEGMCDFMTCLSGVVQTGHLHTLHTLLTLTKLCRISALRSACSTLALSPLCELLALSSLSELLALSSLCERLGISPLCELLALCPLRELLGLSSFCKNWSNWSDMD